MLQQIRNFILVQEEMAKTIGKEIEVSFHFLILVYFIFVNFLQKMVLQNMI